VVLGVYLFIVIYGGEEMKVSEVC